MRLQHQLTNVNVKESLAWKPEILKDPGEVRLPLLDKAQEAESEQRAPAEARANLKAAAPGALDPVAPLELVLNLPAVDKARARSKAAVAPGVLEVPRESAHNHRAEGKAKAPNPRAAVGAPVVDRAAAKAVKAVVRASALKAARAEVRAVVAGDPVVKQEARLAARLAVKPEAKPEVKLVVKVSELREARAAAAAGDLAVKLEVKQEARLAAKLVAKPEVRV